MILGQGFGRMGVYVGMALAADGQKSTISDRILAQLGTSASLTLKDPNPMVVGNWYYIVVSHDSVNKTFKLWKNPVAVGGVVNPVASTVYTMDLAAKDSAGRFLYFSGNAWTGFGINGSGSGGAGSYDPPLEYGIKCQFDSTGFWNKTLSDNEILYLYNNGNGRAYSELINYYG
jgi:hypothetical protein